MERIFLIAFALLLSLLAVAGDLAGAFIGTVSGFVANAQGVLVSPRATVETTTHVVTDASGRGTGATVSGTLACANGLSLTIVFSATYQAESCSLSGSFSDVPGSTTLNKPVAFTKTGNLSLNPGIPGAPNVRVPLNISSSFPFVMQ